MSSGQFAPLDLALMKFPTDRLTIGNLRNLMPEISEKASTLDDFSFMCTDIWATMHAEIVLAQKAYASRLGLPDPFPDISRREVLDLGKDYRSYGLAHGVHESKLLVRSIEKQAAEQAEKNAGISGRSP